MPMESSWEEACLESDLGPIPSVSEISAVGAEDGGKMRDYKGKDTGLHKKLQ